MSVRLLSVGELLRETLDIFLNLESRVWRSLRPLLLQPGKLTREYIDGRRADYLPPFRTYFVFSLMFFLLASLSGPSRPAAETTDVSDSQEPFRLVFTDENQVEIRNPEDCGQMTDLFGSDLVGRLAVRACLGVVADRGESLGRRYRDNVPVLSFFCIPLIAALMWPLYAASRRRYVEHLMFLFHTHGFFFAFATLALLASWLSALIPLLDVPIMIVTALGWLYVPVYAFVALYRVYGQSAAMTMAKLLSVGVIHFVCLTVVFLVGLVLTAASI